jgi:hypothetical protein
MRVYPGQLWPRAARQRGETTGVARRRADAGRVTPRRHPSYVIEALGRGIGPRDGAQETEFKFQDV